MTSTRLAMVLFVILNVWPTFAARPGLTGSEKNFWDRHSVVYGEISSLKEDDATFEAVVALDVRATLAGSLDPAANPTIRARAEYGISGAAVSIPPVKSHVIVVVLKTENDRYLVPSRAYRFMPLGDAIVAVKGFEDSTVDRVIASLRLARAVANKGTIKGALSQPAPTGADRADIMRTIHRDIQQGKSVSLTRVEQALGPASATKVVATGLERRLYLHRGEEHGLVIFVDHASKNVSDACIVTPY